MNNDATLANVAGQPAVTPSVREINRFRERFTGLSGYYDLVSDSVQGLHKEGEISLRECLKNCADSGIHPYAEQEKIKTFTLQYPELKRERLSQATA